LFYKIYGGYGETYVKRKEEREKGTTEGVNGVRKIRRNLCKEEIKQKERNDRRYEPMFE